MLLDAGDQVLGELDELLVAQEPPVDELANLFGGDPGVLLDLVQHLEGDFTASGSSRHDQLASGSGPRRRRIPARKSDFPRAGRPRPCETGQTVSMPRSGRPALRLLK